MSLKKDSALAEQFWGKFTLSAASATCAETVTYPLDITKTRLQLQGEHVIRGTSASTPHRGMVGTAVGIVQEEGFFSLWRGIKPAILRHIIYTGFRIGFYEFLREQVLQKSADGSFAIWKAILGGLTAGGLAQFLASPADLVKIQMQMEGRRILEGHKPRVKSMWHSFAKIAREGGIRGLWSGWLPNVQRAALVNMGDLATYDTAKHALLRHTSLRDNYVTHALSSGMSGLVAAIISTPADVVKTRIMNQPTKNGRAVLYDGALDCLLKTIRQEGFMALYKGFVPIWARMAPWSLTFWLSYEQIRKLAGSASF